MTVRPREWQAHLDAAEKEDARIKRVTQRHEAEKAVMEAAKEAVQEKALVMTAEVLQVQEVVVMEVEHLMDL